MSRSEYGDDYDVLSYGRWRGQVASATKGKRGQKLFIELAKAMDEMPVKELIANELETKEGSHCALGVLGKAKGLDMSRIDPEDAEQVALDFDIAHQLAREIVYMNDERFDYCSPAQRWQNMREWVEEQIKKG